MAVTRKNVEKAFEAVKNFPAFTESDLEMCKERDQERLRLLQEHSILDYERKLGKDADRIYAYFAGRIKGALDMACALHVGKASQIEALSRALSIPKETARQFVEEYEILVWLPGKGKKRLSGN